MRLLRSHGLLDNIRWDPHYDVWLLWNQAFHRSASEIIWLRRRDSFEAVGCIPISSRVSCPKKDASHHLSSRAIDDVQSSKQANEIWAGSLVTTMQVDMHGTGLNGNLGRGKPPGESYPCRLRPLSRLQRGSQGLLFAAVHILGSAALDHSITCKINYRQKFLAPQARW